MSSNEPKPAAPAQSRGGFGNPGRPRRRMAANKQAMLSPEERRAIEARERKMIDEHLAAGRVTRLPDMWAQGSISNGIYGQDL